MSKNVQMVNDCAAPQVKEIFAETTVAGTPSLPVSDMC